MAKETVYAQADPDSIAITMNARKAHAFRCGMDSAK